MGVYGRMLMKKDHRYRLQVAEGVLEAIDELLGQVGASESLSSETIDRLCSAIGAWREGVVLKRGDL